jgi:hypothetical protein
MNDRDLIAALLYDRYRQTRRMAPAPHTPPVAAALALIGIVVTVAALGLFLWAFAFVSSLF